MKLSERRRKQFYPDFMYETGIRHTPYTEFWVGIIVVLLILVF